MMWILMAAIAAIIGMAMYSSIEKDLPEMLQLHKDSGSGAIQNAGGTQATSSKATANFLLSPDNWVLNQENGNIDAMLEAQSPLVDSSGTTYDAPVFHLMCYQGSLYSFVDAKMELALIDENAKSKQTEVGMPSSAGTVSKKWTVGKGYKLYPSNSLALAKLFNSSKQLQLSIQYKDLGSKEVSFKLPLKGQAIDKVISSCSSTN